MLILNPNQAADMFLTKISIETYARLPQEYRFYE